MVSLPGLTAIRFSDADAGDFLHNQLSADVLALSSGESTFACYCEPKGRVLALMLVSRHEDDYIVLLSSSLADSIAKRLKIYVMRAKVSVEPLDDYAIVGVHSDNESQSPSGQLVRVKIPDNSNSFLIVSNASPVVSNPGSTQQWKLSEIRAGISWLGPETSGQFLPQMLGFDQLGAVNFHKGCYPGQEIVARTHYLGKVKRHPRIVCAREIDCPDPMEKIQILSGDQFYAAVVVDCSHLEDGSACIFTITRMEPDLVAEKIEIQGQVATLA